MKKSASLGAVVLLVLTTLVGAPAADAAPVDSVKGHGSTPTLEFDVNVTDAAKEVKGSFSYVIGDDSGTVQATCILVNGDYAVVAGRAPAGNSTVPHTAILAVRENSVEADQVSISFPFEVKNGCLLQPDAIEFLRKGKVKITDN